MNEVNELFNSLCKIDDYKLIRFKYLQLITRLIYLCLKYRYCYQIGLTQKIKWVRDVNYLALYYYFGLRDADKNNDSMDFFYEGESLKEIFDEVVHFMSYQGYHDIPNDLYKQFAKDKICADPIDQKTSFNNLLKESWFCKYARGDVIKAELGMIKWIDYD